MFVRRLLLLQALMVLVCLILAAQLARLTLVQGDELRQRAEARLERIAWLPTSRGRVLDRHGRVLAHDRASYDLAVEYSVITGAWAVQRAGRYARRLHRDDWAALAPEQRRALIDRYRPAYDAHLEQAWETLAAGAGTTPDELARRREAVVERVERMFDSIVRARTTSAREQQLAMGREITQGIEQRIAEQATRPIAEQRTPHVLASRVDDDTGFLFKRLEAQVLSIRPAGDEGPPDEVPRIPGLEVRDAGDRHYPFDTLSVEVDLSRLPGPLREDATRSVEVQGVGVHILGWMRAGPHAEDVQQRAAHLDASPDARQAAITTAGVDRGRYLPTDAVGSAGLEASLEHTLRGLRGFERYRVDTGTLETLEPTLGRDVRLTLDISLQARIQALMDPSLGLARVQPWHGDENPTMPVGTPINGAAVVLDIETGEILALVSTPTFARDAMRDDPDAIFGDEVNLPAVNRAIAVPYQPGSIVKAPILAAAATFGAWTPGQTIACTGHFLPDRDDVFRCWIYKRFGATHGHALNGPEAIKVSCNIFFYELGRRLGASGTTRAYRLFGVEQPFNLGIGSEFPGAIGPLQRDPREPPQLSPSDTILMGIGQGPVAWTPLHAAEALAILARGGVHVLPRIIADDAPPVVAELSLDARASDIALEGLRLSVNAPEGTGHHITLPGGVRENIFTVPGVEVWGKTGTATAADLRADLDRDGQRETVRSGDHSWFVALAGPQGASPRYAIAVIMEYAGSGARVSGPVTNQIIHALVDEGYLPDHRALGHAAP